MKLVIDLFSKNWVHSDFNIQFIKSVSNGDDLIVGCSGANYLEKLPNTHKIEISGWWDLITSVPRLIRYEEVIFLVMLNKFIPLVIFFRLLGKDVSYVIHKYNLTTRTRRRWVNCLYFLLEKLSITSISLEEPNEIFRRNKIISIDMWDELEAVEPSVNQSTFNRIAFIGKPVPGKNFEILSSIAEELNKEIVIYCDDPIEAGCCTIRTFDSDITDCDLIWGYYDPCYYKGIQSGLCYPALVNGLKIITNENIGFIYFESKYPQYLLSLKSTEEIYSLLKG